MLRQVYAVSGCGRAGTGALHVLHGSHATELLYAGEPSRQGITGLWSLPAAPGEAAAALVVISFASGSRAMTAGAPPDLDLTPPGSAWSSSVCSQGA
jgi:hypothetical protein